LLFFPHPNAVSRPACFREDTCALLRPASVAVPVRCDTLMCHHFLEPGFTFGFSSGWPSASAPSIRRPCRLR
jgi:hypothetical protein